MFRTGFLTFVCLTLVLAGTGRIAFSDPPPPSFGCVDDAADTCWSHGSHQVGQPSTCVSDPDPCVMTPPNTSCSCQEVIGDPTNCTCR